MKNIFRGSAATSDRWKPMMYTMCTDVTLIEGKHEGKTGIGDIFLSFSSKFIIKLFVKLKKIVDSGQGQRTVHFFEAEKKCAHYALNFNTCFGLNT